MIKFIAPINILKNLIINMKVRYNISNNKIMNWLLIEVALGKVKQKRMLEKKDDDNIKFIFILIIM